MEKTQYKKDMEEVRKSIKMKPKTEVDIVHYAKVGDSSLCGSYGELSGHWNRVNCNVCKALKEQMKEEIESIEKFMERLKGFT